MTHHALHKILTNEMLSSMKRPLPLINMQQANSKSWFTAVTGPHINLMDYLGQLFFYVKII